MYYCKWHKPLQNGTQSGKQMGADAATKGFGVADGCTFPGLE